jgi:hypothetical protein
VDAEGERERFLPPQPAGPEPELGDRPAQQPPQPPAPPPPAQQQPAPPQTYGYPPPPPGYGYPQAPPPPPPPGYGYPPQWGYPQPQAPDNGQAVAGFVCSLVAIGLLVISGGLSTIVSLGAAIAGIVCSRNGKKKVDAGETPKHRGLAQAGFIIGWVSLGLSILAIIGWTALILIEAGSDDSIFDDSQTIRI